MSNLVIVDSVEYLQVGPNRYELKPWIGRRTDVYGNNRACNCKDLRQVIGMNCVCLGKCWCPSHGGPRCVGGHD